MSKKHLKLVDRRACTGKSVRALRDAIRKIESGEYVGINIAAVKRNGAAFAYADNECPLRGLGAIRLLSEYVERKNFSLL